MQKLVANELGVEEIIDINYKSICLDKKNMEKLNTFMHAGRNELMFADNIVVLFTSSKVKFLSLQRFSKFTNLDDGINSFERALSLSLTTINFLCKIKALQI